MKRVRVVIKGKVQGVFFRDNTKKLALKISVNGFVRNVQDYVEAVFIGEDEAVNKMLDFCSKGPEGAKVKLIELENYIGEDIDDFKVKETV
jgi:acylphosphatase